MARLGVFGGSFDPPHLAHVLAVASALALGDFDRVLVVPVFAHAYSKQLCPFQHRLRMTELAFRDIARARVSDIEAHLPAPNRTLDTLQALLAREPHAELRLIVGSDILLEAAKWHAFPEVVRLAPPFVLGRAGFPHPEAQTTLLPDVSSTEVRALLCRGEPAAAVDLRRLVPHAVLAYIAEHGLYTRSSYGP